MTPPPQLIPQKVQVKFEEKFVTLGFLAGVDETDLYKKFSRTLTTQWRKNKCSQCDYRCNRWQFE